MLKSIKEHFKLFLFLSFILLVALIFTSCDVLDQDLENIQDDNLIIEDVDVNDDIKVEFGTSKDSIINNYLSENAEVTLSNGKTEVVQIANWSSDNYDGNIPGAYTFRGYFTVEDISDSVLVDVVVKEENIEEQGKIVLKIPEREVNATSDGKGVIPEEATHIDMRIYNDNRNINYNTEIPEGEKTIEVKVPFGNYSLDIITYIDSDEIDDSFRNQVLTMGATEDVQVDPHEVTHVNVSLEKPELEIKMFDENDNGGEEVQLGDILEAGKGLKFNYIELPVDPGYSFFYMNYKIEDEKLDDDKESSETLFYSNDYTKIDLPTWEDQEIESVNFNFYYEYRFDNDAWSDRHYYYYPQKQYENEDYYLELIHPEGGIIIEL